MQTCSKRGGAEYFRGTLRASTLGVAKPEAEIFHAAAREIGVTPGEMLHVGDDFRVDVLGALGAGMQAAWLVREPHPTEIPLEHAVHTPHITVQDLSALCLALGGPKTLAYRTLPT